MQNNILQCNDRLIMPDWMTIQEAVDLVNSIGNEKITTNDIYRNALCGNIFLSIYFQSPIVIRRIKKSNGKVKLKPVSTSFLHHLCMVDNNCFLSGRKLITSTFGEFITPTQWVIETTLDGYELVLVQALLARSLGISCPHTGRHKVNYGLSINISGEIFQVFEEMTWQMKIINKLLALPQNMRKEVSDIISKSNFSMFHDKAYFPIHDLPQDACFVIKNTDLAKMTNIKCIRESIPNHSTRISTPLSRLFWLACRNNESIGPLIRQPYKLLSIFEQWALAEGMTDRLSGDTLKAALERGSP